MSMTLRDFQTELEHIYNWATKGCGNHGCVINPPKGMGTNASCQCSPQSFADALLDLGEQVVPESRYKKWDK
jgi:hypothetical protein